MKNIQKSEYIISVAHIKKFQQDTTYWKILEEVESVLFNTRQALKQRQKTTTNKTLTDIHLQTAITSDEKKDNQ